MTTQPKSGATLTRADTSPVPSPASQGITSAGHRQTSSPELVATARVFRDLDGSYAVDLDFGGHGEWNGGFRTLDGAFERCREVVRDNLRKRPTLPEMEPIPRILPDDVP